MTKVVITGMGHSYPGNVIENEFFDSLDIGSSSEWIVDRVGIEQRHSVLTKEQITDLRFNKTTHVELAKNNLIPSIADICIEPWEIAWNRSSESGSPVNIDHLICGTSTADWEIPANACTIANELGIMPTSFDVNSACSSFIVNMHVARNLLIGDSAKSIAIFNPERYSTRMNYQDRANCVLFGDGASACIIEKGDDLKGLEVIDTIVKSNPSGYRHVTIPFGDTFQQNGKAVQKFAISKTIAVTLEILEKHGLTKNDMSYFIGHQANLRMLTSACNKQNVGPERHLFNVNKRGNQGAAGAPNVLSENWDKYKSGDIIVVAVVGSGLTWGAALLKVI